jgi:tRNA pseudouridine38-40 synthase
MRHIKLQIAFEGTHYAGWQSQRNSKTIQEIFESRLTKIFKEKINIHGSSRTDAGVHAKGFVAHFKTESRLSDRKIKDAINYYLPRDIVVLSAKTMPDTFHARFSAKSKTYQYEIWNQRTRPAYDKAAHVLWIPKKLSIRAMKEAARFFVGKQDFNAFRDSAPEPKKTIRTIKQLAISRQGPSIRIKVTADGFLKHMVRIIAGTLIEVGRKKIPPSAILSILKSKTRCLAGPTAKPQGLTLLKVRY